MAFPPKMRPSGSNSKRGTNGFHLPTERKGKKSTVQEFEIPLSDQRLWELDDPYLYETTVSLYANGQPQDQVDSYFGQRKISTTMLPGSDYPYVALNNKPVYLQLCLDQSYHPEGYYTFPSDEFMRDEILLSKRLGLNGNRIHIKVEVPRKLYWADKLGLLIMADTPNFWGEPTDSAKKDWEHCMRAQVKRDYNHPSIFSWVNFNETWGLFTNTGETDEKANPNGLSCRKRRSGYAACTTRRRSSILRGWSRTIRPATKIMSRPT